MYIQLKPTFHYREYLTLHRFVYKYSNVFFIFKIYFIFRFDFATAQRLSSSITEGIAALGVNDHGVPTFAAEVWYIVVHSIT